MFQRPAEPGWLSILLHQHSGQLNCAHVLRPRGTRPKLNWVLRLPLRRDGVVEQLRQLRRQYKLQAYRCSTALPRGAYQTFEVPAPKVDRAEWRDALRWVVKATLEFPVDEAMIEAISIPNDGAPLGREPMTFVVAARRDAVAERVQAFQRAGLQLGVVSVATMAQRNVATLFEEPGRGLAFIGFYRLGLLITFSRDRAIYATRFIEIPRSAVADDADNAHRRTELLERLVLEVQRSLDSFDRQFSHVALQRVVVSEPSGCTALLDALRSNLNQRVEVADLADVMDMSASPIAPREQADWLMSIGLALQTEAGA